MKILTRLMGEEELAILQGIAPEATFINVDSEEELLRECEDAEVFIGPKPTPEVVRKAKKLRWVQIAGAGIERFLFPEMVNSDIVMTNARGTTGAPIAEHVMALVLAFTRRLHITLYRQKERVWETHANLPVIEIAGDTMGIIGLGGIGLQVAKRANAFDMRILAIDPTPAARPEYIESIRGPEGLHEMLGQSDFVVICCPETRETRGMIGREELRAMKPTAFLFNVGRGPIVDHDALIEALKDGDIAGAGLDAMSPEPLPAESPLWDMPNVIITPHHAGQSPKAPARRFQLFCENLRAYVAGRPLTSVVDKKKMY